MACRSYFAIPAAGAFYFFSAWILMMFADMVHEDVGIEPFGYTTSLIVTIGLWLVMAPVIATIAHSVETKPSR
jgi:hypothetical protein